MTRDELAAKLNGRQYRNEITDEECKQAKAAGLVVILGASDDLLEVRGVSYDEIGAYNGTVAYLTPSGHLLDEHRDCECKYCGYKAIRATATKVTAEWCENEFDWWIYAECPFAGFEIYEDCQRYCRGIVIDIRDLKGKS